jgi:hypothetical protein
MEGNLVFSPWNINFLINEVVDVCLPYIAHVRCCIFWMVCTELLGDWTSFFSVSLKLSRVLLLVWWYVADWLFFLVFLFFYLLPNKCMFVLFLFVILISVLIFFFLFFWSFDRSLIFFFSFQSFNSNMRS